MKRSADEEVAASLSLLLVLCVAKPVYRWMKDCSHWPPMDPLDYWLTVRNGCC